MCVCVCLELCGAFVVAFGEFQMVHSRFASLVTTFWPIYPANTLVVTGTIVTCVCFLGVLGSMKENRCMIITVSSTHSPMWMSQCPVRPPSKWQNVGQVVRFSKTMRASCNHLKSNIFNITCRYLTFSPIKQTNKFYSTQDIT